MPWNGFQSHLPCGIFSGSTQVRSRSTSTYVSGCSGSPKILRGFVCSRNTKSSMVRRPSLTAVRSSGSIVSSPGKPGSFWFFFSSLVWGAWCEEKTSMMSMLSHSACLSLAVARRGRMVIRSSPCLSTSSSVRKRCVGLTPQVTLAPRRFASRTTIISSLRDRAHTWIARSYIMAIMRTAASVLDSERTTMGILPGQLSKCSIHTVKSSICRSAVVA
mmetsp:Transcript_78021/g.114220  ORF Transcript_78021/g.114220 Transcript_78021/m.114220 type:complete len:217 (+) Transcript_78021:1829-2479(+)